MMGLLIGTPSGVRLGWVGKRNLELARPKHRFSGI